MAKYDVTPELASIIKSTRLQNNVPARQVAEHIGKSPSYLSKLERGDIKTIQETELTQIFQFIFGNKENYQDFLDSTLSKILESLELRFDKDEIDEQLWFYNYDTVRRLIPVPDDLVNAINDRLQDSGITLEDICERINANEDIHPQVNNADKYPFNEWQGFIENHQVVFTFIKMHVSLNDIKNILNKKTTSCNYVTMLSLVYYLMKCERKLPAGDNPTIMNEARDFINSYKFFSLSDKSRLSRVAQSKSEVECLLSSFDVANSHLMADIIAAFHVCSELNIARTNECLTDFVNNLKWDSGFMLRILSLDFNCIHDAGFGVKKQLISDIEALIEKYKYASEEKKTVEFYD